MYSFFVLSFERVLKLVNCREKLKCFYGWRNKSIERNKVLFVLILVFMLYWSKGYRIIIEVRFIN